MMLPYNCSAEEEPRSRSDGPSGREVAHHAAVVFDRAVATAAFKRSIRRMLREPYSGAALRARYGSRAAMLGDRDLDAATATVERWWRSERKAFAIASALGRGTRLSLEILTELRLVLRLFRHKRMRAQYQQIAAALANQTTTAETGTPVPADAPRAK